MFRGKSHHFAVLIIVCSFIAIVFWGYASAQEPVEPPYSGLIAVGNTFCPPMDSPDCCPAMGSTYPAMCNLCSPRQLFAEPSAVPPEDKFAWTSQLFQPGSTSEYEILMCAGIPYQDICPPVPGIWGIPGTSTITSADFESLMCDPTFDSANKEKDLSGNVTGWWVLIPIVDRVDPMSPPDPNPVLGYAKVHIIEVCAPGSPGCRGAGSCIPAGYCSGGDEKIVIDKISCLPCAGSSYISVNPISFNFGPILVGTSSAPQALTILNDGSGILAIYPLQTIGTHYSEFSIPNDNCSGKLLLPLENCTIDIVFSPETQGEKDASLSLSSNDPDTPTLDVPLSGTGMPLIECAVVPDWPVVVQGGTLGLQGIATNNTDEVQIFKYATRITLPNGNKYPNTGYLVGPIEVTLNPHQTKSRHLSQYIPHYAPLGTYTYHGYVGNYGVGIYDGCTFTFTVNSQGHQECTACHQW